MWTKSNMAGVQVQWFNCMNYSFYPYPKKKDNKVIFQYLNETNVNQIPASLRYGETYTANEIFNVNNDEVIFEVFLKL